MSDKLKMPTLISHTAKYKRAFAGSLVSAQSKKSKKKKKFGRRLKSIPKAGRLARFNESFNREQFRIRKNKLITKKVHKAKHIPRDIRKGNPFADLPVIRDEDLKDGIYNLQNQGFIPKEVDVEPILGRDKGILNIKQVDPHLLLDERDLNMLMAKNNSFVNFNAS